MIEDAKRKMLAFAFPINPEPWAVGSVSVVKNKQTGRHFPKVAPNHTLQQYQNAIQSELDSEGGWVRDGKYVLRTWFWRQVPSYTSLSGKRASRNSADGTNLLKATEDALQGILIDNDANVVKADWNMVSQSKETSPIVGVELWYGVEWHPGVENYINTAFPKVMTEELQRSLEIARRSATQSDLITGNAWKG